MNKFRHRRYIREADDDTSTISLKQLRRKAEKEAEKIDDEIEDMIMQDELKKIANDLGYDFIGGQTSGSFSLSNTVEVFVKYNNDRIQKLEVRILNSNPRYNCMRNSTDVEELAVQLQTATLIVKNIKRKLM